MAEENSTLLIRDIDHLVTMDRQRPKIEKGWLLIRGNLIEALGGPGEPAPAASQFLDAGGHIVLPGLVNTHHHLFQTLLRAIPCIQNCNLFPWLIDLYKLMGSLTEEAVYVSTLVGLAELMLSGCTTAEDHAYLHVGDTGFDTEIAAARRLGIRFHLTRGSQTIGESKGGLPPDWLVEDEDDVMADCERLIKTYHDGRPGGMVRIDLGPCSVFSVSQQLMRQTAELGRRHGVRLHTHLWESHDETNYCVEHFGVRPPAYVESLGWMGPDVWWAHGVQPNLQEVRRMAQTGTSLAHCPSSNMRLGSGISPVKEMLEEGVKVGIGVDGSASNDSSHLLAEARMAMLLQRVKHGAAAVTAEQALEMATVMGAQVLGRDDVGVLRPGMVADIIGFDLNQLAFAGALHDPAAALVFCTPSQVGFSIIDGQVRVWEGKIVGLDLPVLIAEQNRLSKELVARTEQRFGRPF